jgi:tetratricopeptide (TPR) repeat protein
VPDGDTGTLVRQFTWQPAVELFEQAARRHARHAVLVGFGQNARRLMQAIPLHQRARRMKWSAWDDSDGTRRYASDKGLSLLDPWSARVDTRETMLVVTPRDEAEARYRELIAQADSPAARMELGSILVSLARPEEAITHYARALRLKPSPGVKNELAWHMATHNLKPPPDTPDAVQLAEQACAETKCQEPNLLDTLAAAYARASRFADAVRTADRALALAQEKGFSPLAAGIGARRRLYLASRPYDQPTTPTTAPASGGPPARQATSRP